MGKHAAPGTVQVARTRLRGSDLVKAVARTAGFNVAVNVTAALAGVILARAVGPTVRGEYAAVTAWFGLATMVGGMGQPAALCYYVAHDPRRARGYVATSRAMMLTAGAAALATGIAFASVLAHGNTAVADGYRTAFAGSAIAFVGASYTFSLQARDLKRWNRVRLSQPLVALVAMGVLWALRMLSLETAIMILVGTMFLQLVWAWHCCVRCRLAPGRARMGLVRPLATYGAAQIAAVAPATLNTYMDQLVLSQTVPAADLGRYAIAVSITMLPIPLVAAIGYVAFPSLAARRNVSAQSHRLLQLAVLVSAGIAAAILAPIALSAYWVVPLVFGAAYRGAVPLVWILAPGGVFLACNQVIGDLLRGRNRPAFVAGSEGLAAVFTVGLLIALLPLVGVAGAAIASTVAYGVSLAAMTRCLWRLPVQDEEGRPIVPRIRGRRAYLQRAQRA
jgi:O-antigen/teichoic acid export membrane protein